jgi:hypothetical protein
MRSPIRWAYVGLVIGVSLGLVIASAFAGASLGKLRWWLIGGMVAVGLVGRLVEWITRSPKEEPDWDAAAVRHQRLAYALVIGGFTTCVVGFLALGALGAVAWFRPSFSNHWGFVAALFLAVAGGAVALTGQRILDAAKRAAR